MIEIRTPTPEDIYPAIDDLIHELREAGLEADANVLAHRMYEVVWTTGNELFEELVNVLSDLSAGGRINTSPELSVNVNLILGKLREGLAQVAARRTEETYLARQRPK